MPHARSEKVPLVPECVNSTMAVEEPHIDEGASKARKKVTVEVTMPSSHTGEVIGNLSPSQILPAETIVIVFGFQEEKYNGSMGTVMETG